MTPEASEKPSGAGLSLYANLLNTSSTSTSTPSTISRAPVVFKQAVGEDLRQDDVSAQKQQISAASLRFQPTKRPQISTQKPKSRPPLQKVLPSVGNVNPQDTLVTKTTVISAKGTGKNTLADWTAEDNDVNDFYGGEKRQRGGRKKRKKNKEESYVSQNWDDIYDPSRPNSYEEYKNSDEKIMELKEWKDKLYAHRVARRRSNDSDSTGDDRLKMQKNQSARPGLSFAPPAHFEQNFPPSPDHPPANVPDDPTGEDAYARRMRLSSTGNRTDHTTRNSGSLQGQAFYPPPPPLSATATAPAPPPPAAYDAQPQLSSQHEPEMLPSTISKAPVRYILPPAPVEIPRSEAELEKALQTYEAQEDAVSEAAPRSLRPGQKGFAERLMSKYGWTKGSGLGASGAGIVNPLRVQLEKQKKKPDSEGGGFVGPGGRGKIVGGKKKAGSGAESETGKFGLMSEVVVLHGMVDGIDLVAELEAAGDGGIMQEIGEECGEKYGRVERVFIDRSNPSKAPVFVKFTSQLSALRAVNALESRIFNGNTITARFFDTDKFESGIYS